MIDFAAIEKTLLDAADMAAKETMPRFRTDLAVDNKWDVGFDPVTDADRQAEVAIRELIASRFPDHGLIGEEWDPKLAESPYEWIIDPIDGTRAFICGVPVWGTLIGFSENGRAKAGLMAQPFTGETFLGLPGATVYRRGDEVKTLKTSGVTTLEHAKLSTTAPEMFEAAHAAPWAALKSKVLQTRYGLDCYAYCLLAAGHLDLVVEVNLKNVDIAPLIPVVTNAGGVVASWDNGPAEAGGSVIAAATPELFAAAKAVLDGAK